MTTYNGFKNAIEARITEKEMMEPSLEKFESFISANDLEKKEINNTVSGKNYKVVAYYINGDLCKIELSCDNRDLYSGLAGNQKFDNFIHQIKNQLNINI